jgi:hypothetical protein
MLLPFSSPRLLYLAVTLVHHVAVLIQYVVVMILVYRVVVHMLHVVVHMLHVVVLISIQMVAKASRVYHTRRKACRLHSSSTGHHLLIATDMKLQIVSI